MKIGFDAKRLFSNFTGLGNYSRTLLRSLIENYPEQEYFLFTPKLITNNETSFFISQNNTTIIYKKDKLKTWRSFTVKNDLVKNNIQIYHGLSHELPYGIDKTQIKTVVTIHDLIYKLYPETYGFINAKLYDIKYKKSCEIADKIIAISNSTKQDLIELYDIKPDKIKVVYQSCNKNFKTDKTDKEITNIKKKYLLPDSYLLYVGSVIERKNLLTIVKAVELLDNELKLVIIGNGNKYKKKVEKYIYDKKIEDKFIWINSINDSYELSCIYAGAEIFIYPSIYEGFGIPVLEALYSKVPVITSNKSSLPEVAGKYSFCIEPYDYIKMAEIINSIHNNTNLRQRIIEEGYNHALKFDDKTAAEQVYKIYQSLLT